MNKNGIFVMQSHKTRSLGAMIFCLSIVCTHAASAQAQHVGDIAIARSAAGVLKVGGPDTASTIYYLPFESPLFPGWNNTDPGLDKLVVAQPANDMYPIQTGSQIWMQFVSVDPAFRAVTISPQFFVLENPGDEALLGNASSLHSHPVWHIDSSSPAYDPAQCIWQVNIRLLDKGTTNYAPSEPFLMNFTNEPTRTADGDFEPNGQVNLADAAELAFCTDGPDTWPTPDGDDECPVLCLNAFDFDADLDVDLQDVASMMNAFKG